MTEPALKNAYKSGRCTDGFERGAGRVIHSVGGSPSNVFGPSLCGTRPGRLSAMGWVTTDQPLTCQRCIKRGGVPRSEVTK